MVRTAVIAGLLLSTVAIAAPEAAPVEVAVVVHESSPIEAVALADLRRIFGRGQRSVDGKRVVPVNLHPGNPARVVFDRAILKLEAHEVGRYWVDRKIRGQSGPPRAFPGVPIILRFVSSVAQVIAYVPADSVPPGVRVLRVEGLKPGEAGYPLKGAP